MEYEVRRENTEPDRCVSPDSGPAARHPVRRRTTARIGTTALLAVLLFSIAERPAAAQLGVDTLSASASISLLTILPGDEIYSMFGHTAIRVRDPAQGIDHSYNYGTFAFGNPITFGARFAYGRLDYFLSDAAFPRMLAFYREVARRPILEQELNLTHGERLTLFRFLEWNAKEDNRSYRYDFLYDNCATRVRDLFYENLETLSFNLLDIPAETFRGLLDSYAADRPFLDLGWDLLMGTPVDREAQQWETMFLPLPLMAAVDSATIDRGAGAEPFVTRKDTLFWIEGRGMPNRTYPWPSILMWTLFAAGALLTLRERWRGSIRIARWFDAVIFGVVGLAGLLMLLMWFVSMHSVTTHNWNLLWAWPTHLLAAVYLMRARLPRWARNYLIVHTVVTVMALLGWTMWPQNLHVAVIPVLLLLALRSAWRASERGARPE